MAEIGVTYRPTKYAGKGYIRRKVISSFIDPGHRRSMITVLREDRADKQTEHVLEDWFDGYHVPESEWSSIMHGEESYRGTDPDLRTIRYCARCGEIAGSATGFTKECVGNLKPEHDIKTAEVQLPDPLFTPEFQR